jgi:CRISPR-associated protein (TIGR03986 family)
VTVAGAVIVPQQGRWRLERAAGQSQLLEEQYLLAHRPGLDGQGLLNSLFQGNPARRGYPWVLIDGTNGTIDIPPEVVAGWERTLRHLRDQAAGHLLRHPMPGLRDSANRDQAVRNIDALIEAGIKPGDVVFFEREKQGPQRVVTMGHHFRYRWRYRDTIREAGNLREVLAPRPIEMGDDQGRPCELTAARLMFGYVGTTDGAYHDDQQTTHGIGVARTTNKRGDFAQMAGRVAFNAAVEQDTGAAFGDRFLAPERGGVVLLRPLGSPKPSAVEHYLSQEKVGARTDAGLLCTYGDTADDQTAGELLGRKFYLHQPLAGQPDHHTLFELVPRTGVPEDERRTMLTSDQAGVGYLVSKPGRTFRFRVQFVDLRPWELGALLFALSPTRANVERLAMAWPDQAQTLRGAIPAGARFAHKLGHGRPLGLGSVAVEPDFLFRIGRSAGACLERVEAGGERPALIDAFASFLRSKLGSRLRDWVGGVLVPWLKLNHYRDRPNIGYPRADDGTIFGHHTALRSGHGGGRKRLPQGDRPRHGLRPLE